MPFSLNPVIRHDTTNSDLTVFIHGFIGDSDKTWTKSGSKSFWELLDEEPNLSSDYSSFEYFSEITGLRALLKTLDPLELTSKEHNLQIDDIADMLLAELRVKAEAYQNLHLIGHSMGGLIAKSLILKAHEYDLPPIKSFVSIATPHYGAIAANLLAPTRNPHAKEMEILSDYVSDLQDRWIKSAQPLPSTIYLYGKFDTWVKRTSAAPSGVPNRLVYPTNCTHKNICKPKKTTDVNYLAVKQHLEKVQNGRAFKSEEFNESEAWVLTGDSFEFDKFYLLDQQRVHNLVMDKLAKKVEPSYTRFDSTLRDLISNEEAFGKRVFVYGEPGEGKSLLSYSSAHYCRKQARSRGRSSVFYVDCKSFEKDAINNNKIQDFDEIVRPLCEKLQSGAMTVIVDGVDELNPVSKEIVDRLRPYFNNNNFCIFIRTYRQFSELNRGVSYLSTAIPNSEYFCSYDKNTIEIDNYIELAEFASRVYGLEEQVVRAAAEFLVKHYFESRNNLRLLHILAEHFRSNKQPSNPAVFLKEFFLLYVEHFSSDEEDQRDYLESAEVFSYSILSESMIPIPNTPKEMLVKRISTQSIEMMGFLASSFVCHEIREIPTKAENEFRQAVKRVDHVYPYLMNKYSKLIITQSEVFEVSTVKSIDAILNIEDIGLRLRAFLCYLLGRVDTEAAKRQAVKILKKEKTHERVSKRVLTSTEDQDVFIEIMVLHRTIYISLMYLDQPFDWEYINIVAKNPRLDSVNRGFHLSYYGDVDSFDEPDMVVFDAGGIFKNTYKQMHGKIVGKYEANSKMVSLAAYTVFSLALVRLQYRNLEDTAPLEEFNELATVITDDENIGNFIKNFVRSFLEYSATPLPPLTHALYKMYSLKTHLRAGWNHDARSVHMAESISAHIDFCVRIAQTYLPSNLQVSQLIQEGELDLEVYEHYDKGKILEYLICHDLGEWDEGDIVTSEKKESNRKREKSAVMKVSLITNCYGAVEANLLADPYQTVFKPWQEFTEYSRAENINSTIAYEIDKLENIIQLLIYRHDARSKLPDFQEFYQELKDKVRDRIVVQILDKIVLPLFPNEGNIDQLN